MAEIILIWIPVIIDAFILFKAIKNLKDFWKTKEWKYFGKFVLYMVIFTVIPVGLLML